MKSKIVKLTLALCLASLCACETEPQKQHTTSVTTTTNESVTKQPVIGVSTTETRSVNGVSQ